MSYDTFVGRAAKQSVEVLGALISKI